MIQKNKEIYVLTGIRALAAWWVVIFHFRIVLYQLFPTSQSFLGPVVNHGYLGVDLFFILSGFIISYQYIDKLQSPDIKGYCQFLWRRFARIYPVHLFTILIFILLVILHEYWQVEFSWPLWLWKKSDGTSSTELIKNLFLLQALTIPITLSWNLPAWSLSCEWLAYLLFPITAVLSLKLPSTKSVLCAIVLLFIMMTTISVFIIELKSQNFPHGLTYALFRITNGFLLGCFAFRLFQAKIGKTLPWERVQLWNLALALLGGILCLRFRIPAYVLSPCMFIFLYGLIWADGLTKKLFTTKSALYWGKVSYSLYMTHYVCLILFLNFFPLSQLAERNPVAKVLGFSLLLGIIMFVAMGTYKLIEEPARRVLIRHADN